MEILPKVMSTVILRRIWREYPNELYMTISSIFSLQQERKINSCTPLKFPSCTARKQLSPMCRFVNVSLNYFVKEGNSVGVIYKRLRGVYGDACMGVSSARGGQNIRRAETRTSPISRTVVKLELLQLSATSKTQMSSSENTEG
jgi:hypothetical protein